MVQKLLLAILKGYKLFLSPVLGSVCRFEPSCSTYAQKSLENHGAMAGSYIALARLARCHPWCDGGLDPVPTRKPRLFAWLNPASTEKNSL